MVHNAGVILQTARRQRQEQPADHAQLDEYGLSWAIISSPGYAMSETGRHKPACFIQVSNLYQIGASMVVADRHPSAIADKSGCAAGGVPLNLSTILAGPQTR